MGIKAVTMFQASDSSQFATRSEALAHDAKHKVFTGLRASIAKASPSFSQGTLIPDLINNPVTLMAVRDALNKALEYHRNYGKLVKSTNKASAKGS